MSLKSIIDNIRKRGLKDILDPERIKMYLDGEYIEKNGIHLSYEEIIPFAEQLVMRLHHPECSGCIKAGNCHRCGCKQPTASMVAEFECEGGNFDKMETYEFDIEVENKDGVKESRTVKRINPEAWESYKESNNLEFIIKRS